MVRHKIHTGNVPSIRKPARKLPLAKREENDKIIAEMEEDQVIEPSVNPWSSPDDIIAVGKSFEDLLKNLE